MVGRWLQIGYFYNISERSWRGARKIFDINTIITWIFLDRRQYSFTTASDLTVRRDNVPSQRKVQEVLISSYVPIKSRVYVFLAKRH
jgi:hypothetical protein